MTKSEKSETGMTAVLRCFLLACITLLPLFGLLNINPTPVDADLVYCPLQKAWVEKFKPQPPPVKRLNVVDKLCAHRAVKVDVAHNVFAKLLPWQVVATEDDAENLIFDYLQFGDAAVRAYRGSPVPSPDNLNRQQQIVKVLNDSQTFNFAESPVAAGARLIPRPPSQILFVARRAFFYDSAKFSIHRSPRPPPLP